MRSIRRILVAVKQPPSRPTPALNKAVQLARGFGAQLELFHVLTARIAADSYIHAGRSIEQAKQELSVPPLRRLSALATQLAGKGGRRQLKINAAVQWDAPTYEAIIRRALAIKADLIVAERHAGRHVAWAWLHPNDWELLRLSPIPVLLVKGRGNYHRPVVLAAVDPSHAMDKPAQLDEQILQIGTALTEALGGRLHTVHAYLGMIGGARPTVGLDQATQVRVNASIANGARQRYEHALRHFRIPRSRRHLLESPADQAIATLAGRLHSAIVVMGSISRSGLERVFFGNTAEKLLDQLRCDLLVVKPPRFKTHVDPVPIGIRVVPSLGILD
ncbi:MAG: universal stress protein [Solirubrobacteraceae bacterium]